MKQICGKSLKKKYIYHAPVEHQMDKHPETKIKSQQITEIIVSSNLIC